MELKRQIPGTKYKIMKLLIVPYGIETNNDYGMNGWMNLLIVPYGIET